jgi:hypothetical protein
MQPGSLRWFTVLVFAASVIGCGDSKWLDLAMMECKDKNDPIMRDIAKATCSQSGRAFSGKLRCKDKDVQALCE